MDNARIESFDLNGVQIKTAVIDIMNKKMIDEHISSLLRSATENRTNVIGFNIQFLFNTSTYNEYKGSYKSRCANLNFCVGHPCLIIRLQHSSHYPYNWSNSFRSVVNLLTLPEYTFVGVGIKYNLAQLKHEYRIGCTNAVELGSLAATLMNKPRLSFCGVDELAFIVNNLDFRKHRPVSMDFDWGSDPLGKELVKLATVNVYSYYMIGSTLLGWDASFPTEARVD